MWGGQIITRAFSSLRNQRSAPVLQVPLLHRRPAGPRRLHELQRARAVDAAADTWQRHTQLADREDERGHERRGDHPGHISELGQASHLPFLTNIQPISSQHVTLGHAETPSSAAASCHPRRRSLSAASSCWATVSCPASETQASYSLSALHPNPLAALSGFPGAYQPCSRHLLTAVWRLQLPITLSGALLQPAK